jgi:hypothetical protein
VPPNALGPRLVELAGSWRQFLVETDDTYLRKNPEPGIFSPLQYGAHVRDLFRVYGDRIEVAVKEDNPSFPQFSPPDDVWEAYNRLGSEELAADMGNQAERLASILGQLGPDDWYRTMVRDGGKDGVYTFTVAGQARYAVHEAYHHLLDANGTLPPGGASKN